MNAKLTTTCALLWIVGLLGMSVSRALFDLGPGAFPFELSARVWGIGGIGYLFLATLACTRSVPNNAPAQRGR